MRSSSSAAITRSAARRDLNHLARVAHHRGEYGVRSREQAELAEEPVRAMDRDHTVLGAVVLDDGYRARLDDEEVVVGGAGTEQHLARLDLPHRPQPEQPRSLLVIQSREGALPVRGFLEAGTEWLGHTCTLTNLSRPRQASLEGRAPPSAGLDRGRRARSARRHDPLV